MILQPPTELSPIDTPDLPRILAADGDTTADLPFENTADLASTPEDGTLDVADSAGQKDGAPPEVEPTLSVNSDSSHAGTSGVPVYHPRLAAMPERRAIGFFAFAACALIAIFVATEQGTKSSSQNTPASLAAKPRAGETQPDRAGVAALPAVSQQKPNAAEPRGARSAAAKRESAKANASLAMVAFQSRSFVTSEQAVAAVFIVKRTRMVRGRALVRWSARSGSADAGIDFSDASGTARFADGQRQVAIYVPLRNDLLKEQDETFKVCLHSPGQARIGGRSCAEVTILDDDDIAPT